MAANRGSDLDNLVGTTRGSLVAASTPTGLTAFDSMACCTTRTEGQTPRGPFVMITGMPSWVHRR